ncbi:MAG: AraC family transcriptional regulator [Verrucomicrobia bacterium]|nr:AraC family transcriptional regulator [Verrucomicrobiota bacterium]
MPKQHKYLNYTTPWGVSLSGAGRGGLSSFLIHESGYQPALENWNHEGVDSPFWRLYHNPKPGCHLIFQGHQIPLNPDTFVLIPADTIFDCCGPVKACHFWLHFTVTRLVGSITKKPILLPTTPLLQTLVQAVIRTHEQPPSATRDQRVHHQSAALLHAIFADWDAPIPETMPEALLETLSLIQKAPHTNLSNPFLAERAGMGVERFIRAFRQHTGQTPAAYVLSTRLRLAGESLALTDHTIDQIAVQNGFPNRHYLSRMFTRQFGCGPAEFRERQHRRRGL